MKKLLVLSVLVVSLTGCSRQKPKDFGGVAINGPGTFNCFDDRLVVKVMPGRADQFNYALENKNIATASATPPLQKSAAWFIFPESPNKVWIFDGTKDVTLIELRERDTKLTSNQVLPELLKRAPEDFVRKLPASVTGRDV